MHEKTVTDAALMSLIPWDPDRQERLMGPEFDPAVVLVLKAIGQLSNRGPDGSVGADGVMGTLVAEGEAGQLGSYPQRIQQIFDQLCADGLLQVIASADSDATRRYRLTRLGWARLEDRDDD